MNCFEEMDKEETLLQIIDCLRESKQTVGVEKTNMLLGGILLALTYLVTKNE